MRALVRRPQSHVRQTEWPGCPIKAGAGAFSVLVQALGWCARFVALPRAGPDLFLLIACLFGGFPSFFLLAERFSPFILQKGKKSQIVYLTGNGENAGRGWQVPATSPVELLRKNDALLVQQKDQDGRDQQEESEEDE